jgi:hypothetical protein
MSNLHTTAKRTMQASRFDRVVLNVLPDHANDGGHGCPPLRRISFGSAFRETGVLIPLST